LAKSLDLNEALQSQRELLWEEALVACDDNMLLRLPSFSHIKVSDEVVSRSEELFEEAYIIHYSFVHLEVHNKKEVKKMPKMTTRLQRKLRLTLWLNLYIDERQRMAASRFTLTKKESDSILKHNCGSALRAALR
jgi:hypothetical protein